MRVDNSTGKGTPPNQHFWDPHLSIFDACLLQVGGLPTTSVDDVQRFMFVMQPTVRKGASPKDKMQVSAGCERSEDKMRVTAPAQHVHCR
jgi:hypothetical protein